MVWRAHLPCLRAGVGVSAFDASDRLKRFFRAITTSTDRQGKPFISTMEAREVTLVHGSSAHMLVLKRQCWASPSYPHPETSAYASVHSSSNVELSCSDSEQHGCLVAEARDVSNAVSHHSHAMAP
jgi:hypothetical protein